MAAPWEDSTWSDRSGPEYRCYVRNLPWATDERSLKDAFASYGPVSTEIAIDRETGRPRGFGFVTFEDNKSVQDAIAGMNSQELGGRNITVDRAQHRSRRWRA